MEATMRRISIFRLAFAVTALLTFAVAGYALDAPPTCHDALGWGTWATGRITPKVVNQGDVATITATIVGGPPAGMGCAYAQWALVGTSSVSVYVPACFELVDYEPKADANHLVLVDGAGVHWSAIWSAPPESTVNDHCFCRSYGGGQWSEGTTCPANLSAGAWGPGAVFTVKVRATCAGSEDRWRKASTMYLSGWWGIGWGNDAEDYYKIGGGEWVSLTADRMSAPADGTPVALSARVYEKNSGVGMPRETVGFSSMFGILNPASAVTDDSGIASATLASPGNVTGADVVMAKISSAQDQITVQFTHVDNPPVNADSQLGKALALQLVGEPVHAGLGNYIYSKRLFDLPGKRLPLGFEVNYNSLDTAYGGPLGPGWTHTFNAALTPAVPPSTDVAIKWGDGHVDRFRDNGSGGFTPFGSNTPVKLTMPDPGQYVATLQNQNLYRFDSGGRLLGIEDLNGNRIALTYSTTEPGQIDHITDTAGRQVFFTYDGLGHIAAITSPLRAGNTVAFQYDTFGNLTGITDPRGKVWGFTYDGAHRIVTHVDAKGVTVVTNAYDAAGRVAHQTDGAGNLTTYAYSVDAAGTTTTITPPSGHAVTHVYDPAYNLVRVVDGEGHVATFGADANGRITGAVDKNGLATGSLYDAAGNPVVVQDRNGAQSQFTFDATNAPTSIRGPLGYTTDSFAYDAKGNLTTITNAEGRASSITVDASGLPTTVTNLNGGEWRCAYDASGLPQTVTDPTGVKVILAHDAAGRTTQVTLPLAGATLQSTHDELGNLLTQTDPLGNLTTFTYDDNGNLATQTFVPTGATTTFEYDWAGRPVKVTGPLGGVTIYAYDADGNLVSATDPDGVTVTRQYDRANRMTGVTDTLGHRVSYGYDANGNVTTVQNELGDSWTTAYDAEGRAVQSSDPLGHRRTTSYDAAGRAIAVTDPLGNTQTFQYSKADRLIGTTLPDQGAITYINNSNGQPIYVADPLGHFWMLEYDAAGRVTSRRDPNGKSETYAYDAMGRLKTRTQRDGSVISYAYDNASRLTTVAMPGQSITYAYDTAGNLTGITDPSGSTTMTYDKLGRCLSRTDPSGAIVAFTYSAAGRLKTMTYPGGNVVTYAYDAAGRLATVTDWRGNQTAFQYDGANRVAQATLPNGTVTRYTYDAAGRTVARVHQTSGGTVLAGYTCVYDTAGHVTSVQRTEPATPALLDSTAAYAYDPINRVLTATVDGAATSYAFDLRGNLTSKVSGAATTTYAYDSLNRLATVSDGTNTTTYAYDGAGSRVAKTFNGSTTRYVREGGTIYCTLDGAGGVQSYNIYGGSLLYTLDPSGAVTVYHGDERGSVVAITDAAGGVVQSYSYDAYGKVLSAAGGLANPFQYVGAYGVLADEDGLYHMRARYYDPDARRFVTEDPLGLAAGLNLYAYAGGDPVNRIDPGGQDWELLPYIEFPVLGPGSDAAIKDAQAYVQWAIGRGQTDEQRIAMNAYSVYFQNFKPPQTPPSILNAAPSLPPGEEKLNPIFGAVDPLAPWGKTRNWDTATNANLQWVGPGGVPQQAQAASPGLVQRTLGNWRTWVGGTAARIAYQKVVARAAISYGVKMLGTDVATLAVGDIAAPVVISAGVGWFAGRGIGEARIAYDPTTGQYVPVDQGLQEMMVPLFAHSFPTVEPTQTTGKAWFDHIRQHTEYLDGLLNKKASW
ncbi:MAG: hypothetical protein B7Z61_00940 [Acidobacteria bacterium 37-71-11]|nr:MAG: hypothetical protein B7Z61_00940 [Acidobacteria bacterium 37-71-11]